MAPPIIEILVVATTEAKLSNEQILTIIKKRIERLDKVPAQMKIENEEPILYINYTTTDAFLDSYQREFPIFDTFLRILLDGQLDLTNINAKSPKKKTDLQENYLILKYKTNWKDPLRKYYEYTLQFTQYFDIGIMVEEIDDGFLLFHHTKEDFTIGQMDKTNPQEIQHWLQQRGIDLQKSGLKTFFESLSSDSNKIDSN
jgi:hypothetical protein